MVLKPAHPEVDALALAPPDAEGVPRRWLAALERFQSSTHQLRDAYLALKKQVHTLNMELEESNRALQCNLKEKERLQSYLRLILEGLGIGVMVADLQGRVTLMNRAARRLLEYEDEGVGERLAELLTPRFPRAVVEDLWGGRRGCSVECPLVQGEETLHLTLRNTPLLDAAGAELGNLITLEDLTELRSMEEEVSRNQRLAAMGEMAVGIAHEVRNPLGSIQLFASLMARESSEKARLETVERIHSAIGAVDGILGNLLTFARPCRPKPTVLDPEALVRECLQFMEPLARQHGIDLVGPLHQDVSEIYADRDLLKQALWNLLLNALQSMTSGGAIEVWVRPLQTRAAADGDGSLAGGVEIGIKDQGEGIPPDVLPRIFDPFFTTRNEGTGLGLAIVHNIVRSHGGRVRIQSEPGNGTCIRLDIPARTGGADRSSKAYGLQPRQAAGRGGTGVREIDG
jgi:PAS domain S-box-containing protein